MRTIKLIFLLIFVNSISSGKIRPDILPGSYSTDQYFPLIKGKGIGVVANQTSLIRGVHLVDSLVAAGFDVKCVFAPEHGFRGDQGAGDYVASGVDSTTGVKIKSLYGSQLKPDVKDLEGIQIMIFDIQDVGVRFYTYISTLQYVMEACAENNIELIVLDRPNPNGFYVDGPILDKKFISFVGMQSIPVVYGMTIGEYSMMLNGEGWLKKNEKCKLKVIPLKNYNHNLKYQLPVPPSPNLPDMDAVYLYPSICFFEGTSVSLGRGTNKPFRLIGFPENESGGVSFKPERIHGVAENPPYRDTLCRGLDLSGEGRNIVQSGRLELKWLLAMYAVYPDKGKFFNKFFDKLAGTDDLRKIMIKGKSQDEIRRSWQAGIDGFKKIRKSYLLYKDFE